MVSRLEKNHPKESRRRQEIEMQQRINQQFDLSKTDKQFLKDLYDRQEKLEQQMDQLCPEQSIKKKVNMNKVLTYTIVIELILLAVVLGFAFMK